MILTVFMLQDVFLAPL